jgi:hypothetical protein
MDGGSKGLDYLMGIDRTNYQNGGMTLQQLQAKAPPGEFLAYINPEEAGVLKALGGSGKKINGIPSFFASSPGDTGGAGGDDGAGGNDAGGGGSTDTGDMGSEAANVSSTQSGAASVGVGGIGGFGDPGVAVGTGFMGSLGNFGRNVANMVRANPISSMVASAVLGPIGSLAFNAARAYGPTGTTGTMSTTESDGDGSGDGGDGRTPISSFDIALLTPDLLDSYNLAKNRDYRLYQGANNPFYSMQAVPSGGIKNVYTEFKKGGRVGFALGGGFGSVPGVRFPPGFLDPMEAMYVNTFGFNPFPKYGFNSYMDYNTARITGTPMNQNISDLEDYLGTLESAREINLPGVTKDLSAEDISRLQEEYVKKMAKTSNALNPTVTASTSTSTPDYRQQALSEMLSRYNVSSLGDIKNFNYLIPGYKDKNNLQVRAFETRIPDLAVSRRAQQLEDAAIRAQQDQEAYKNRISQVDPNALRNSYLQNLQNTSSQSINQFQSQLRSNLVPRENQPQGLDYLTGL